MQFNYVIIEYKQDLESCTSIAVEHINFIPYRINGHLGSGQFGSVEKGLWKDRTTSIPVAVKLLKEGATEMDKVKFLQEAAIMAQFRHPNVVSLYGVVSKTEPVRYK